MHRPATMTQALPLVLLLSAGSPQGHTMADGAAMTAGGVGGIGGIVRTAPSTAPIVATTSIPSAPQSTLRKRLDDERLEGKMLILEYHQFGPVEGRWQRSSDNFREDLVRLHREGYVPVALDDYLDGRLALPVGKRPIVLTFDDASPGQFRLLRAPSSESVESVMDAADPNCAVRIMHEFSKAHPEFPLRGTFYVSFPPFRDKEWPLMLRTLVRMGFDIGNHTYSHGSLSRLDAKGVEREIAMAVREIRKALPGYSPKTLALPFGESPHGDDARRALSSGSYDGISYRHDGVLLVGSGPVPSQTSPRYDPTRLPRLQAIPPAYDKNINIDRMLRYFAQRPGEYIGGTREAAHGR